MLWRKEKTISIAKVTRKENCIKSESSSNHSFTHLHKLALQHREPDRVPIQDWPWKATVDRWRTEGLPFRISPADYFDYELVVLEADTSPQFPVKVLFENEEYIIERDRYGAIRKNHRDYSTTPMITDYPIESRDDWEKIKPRLKPNDFRVD